MLSLFPRGVLDGILNLIGSVSEDFPSYSCRKTNINMCINNYYTCKTNKLTDLNRVFSNKKPHKL